MPSNDPPPPPKPKKEKNPENPHKTDSLIFGAVYVNDLAKAEIKKDKPNFPVGSIIVREKNLTKDALRPETVIAMVKREKDFSRKTNDWEFFVFDGKKLKLTQRETVGSCADCHIRAKNDDWVFREYLSVEKGEEKQEK